MSLRRRAALFLGRGTDIDLAKPRASEQLPLDALLDATGFRSLDLLVLDVEGAEIEVLQTLSRPVRVVVLEDIIEAGIPGMTPKRRAEAEAILLARGFELRC